MGRKNETPIVIMNDSKQPFISLGVKFGKIWIDGKEYVYLQEFDAFLRRDKIKNSRNSNKKSVSLTELIE